MINLKVDEAYAFDYLSILDIKKSLNKDCHNAWQKCFDYIQEQIDENRMNEIIQSDEYKNMVDTNKLTFDAVEKARYGKGITAKEVDDINMVRHKRKLELQKKFFDNILTEYKT
jgi:hypothetical protein